MAGYKKVKHGNVWEPKIVTKFARAQAFKTYDVFSSRFVKFQTLISEIHQYFVDKNVRSFSMRKLFLFFSTKIISVCGKKSQNT